MTTSRPAVTQPCCGEIKTMPGLPRVPAADSIDIGPDGRIVGPF
jgi:formate--tetrahydrofolate ligase